VQLLRGRLIGATFLGEARQRRALQALAGRLQLCCANAPLAKHKADGMIAIVFMGPRNVGRLHFVSRLRPSWLNPAETLKAAVQLLRMAVGQQKSEYLKAAELGG
jgi:hypothetical protein